MQLFVLTDQRRREHTLFPYTTLFRSLAGGPPVTIAPTFGDGGSWGDDGTIVFSSGRPTSLYRVAARSEEHTSELQSQSNLVCRLLLEKKKMRGTNSRRAAMAARERKT